VFSKRLYSDGIFCFYEMIFLGMNPDNYLLIFYEKQKTNLVPRCMEKRGKLHNAENVKEESNTHSFLFFSFLR